MRIFNPCCCISLHTGTKTVAVVDVILATIPIIVYLSTFVPGAYGNHGKPFADFNTGVWTIFIVFLTADVGLSVLLFYAAKVKCIKNLKRWFYIRLVTTSLMVLLIIISSCFQVSFDFILYDLLYTFYRFYTLWVVYLYVGELVHEEIFYINNKKGVKPIPTDFTVSIATNAYPQPYQHNYHNTDNTDPNRNWEDGNKYGHVNGSYVS